MKAVWQWEDVADWIGIKRNDVQRQNQSDDQHKQAYWDYWLHRHPAPSWRILADGLLVIKEHGALEVLQMNYLKGEYICVCYVHNLVWYFLLAV